MPSQSMYCFHGNVCRNLNSIALHVETVFLALMPGVYQEWPGPLRRVASLGDGIPQSRGPLWSEGEVCPLSEASIGSQPAQPGPPSAAGGCAAPGDHSATRCGHGRDTVAVSIFISAASLLPAGTVQYPRPLS